MDRVIYRHLILIFICTVYRLNCLARLGLSNENGMPTRHGVRLCAQTMTARPVSDVSDQGVKTIAVECKSHYFRVHSSNKNVMNQEREKLDGLLT